MIKNLDLQQERNAPQNIDVPIEVVLRCCINDLKKAYQEIGMLESEKDELIYIYEKQIEELNKKHKQELKLLKQQYQEEIGVKMQLDERFDRIVKKNDVQISSLKTEIVRLRAVLSSYAMKLSEING